LADRIEPELIELARRAGHSVEAIAAHAVIAKDDQLLAMAQRIRARAFRRSGELLMQIDARGG
jgi:hypothetical protein